MKDGFGREIDYLRISITDRCNLRCCYCMPSGGIQLLPHSDILSFEEITKVAQVAVSLGLTKLRVTGGEPLVRRDVELLVGKLGQIPGVRDLAMTTNGILLAEHAASLANAGLQRVNISLDTVRADRFTELTRGGDIRLVFAGIQAARKAGLSPIKLNCVVADSSSEPDARGVAEFAGENNLQVRFIRTMNSAEGKFSQVEGGIGGDCTRCNRLRLSANGMVRPCLFSDLGFSVRELGPLGALQEAIQVKPEAGGPCSRNWIRAIGG